MFLMRQYNQYETVICVYDNCSITQSKLCEVMFLFSSAEELNFQWVPKEMG